ncbi:MAG: aminomethyl-transferring glycine dehydrogenase subunit GcvPB [Propionibacteriaceae bacterium]|jgi:glycine dehydrogenase subunit 2|nr:aminomethyl-transferring glycine dehydrogenase subunit GcvPB [Propionibacteriaceae bacterium]
MKLLFEKSVPGRRCSILPPCDVPELELPAGHRRLAGLNLPELSETDVARHYSALERRSYGVNNGFYPLGSCTMKYNPKVNEQAAALPGFTAAHPLQPASAVQGCLETLHLAERYLCALTGMDAMTFQPAAGAHGELTGVMLIKKHHEQRGDTGRTVIIVPDSAHGTNPATAAMCGMRVVNVGSDADGCVDLAELRRAVGPDTAGLMLTNPNTLGIFEKNIVEITRVVHEAGGLTYYDGANLNAIMGVVRPGDMGFDCVHVNLHKTFATPHAGGGPGAGPVGCKDFLAPYLPTPRVVQTADGYAWDADRPDSIGQVRAFFGNFLVVVRALAYLQALGGEGVALSAKNAVLNANYLMKQLSQRYQTAYPGPCMHEFVLTLEKEAKTDHVTAMDIAKALLDHGLHPPTMYFPLIVPEALMVEPTETEGKEVLDEAAAAFLDVHAAAERDAAAVKRAPVGTPVGRPDEARAARQPVLRWRPA